MPNDDTPAISLDNVSEPSAPASQPDPKVTEELLDLEQQQRKAAIRGLVQDIEGRKRYANRVFCLVVGWLTATGAMLLAQGFKLGGFLLADTVTAISTTTASVVGILV
jgi:hypothetical protein